MITNCDYGEQAARTMEAALAQVLIEQNVQKEVYEWLVGKNLTTVLKFADMADDRKEVIANICEPAGLDKGTPEQLVPTIAAWRLASAMGKVEIEERARGEDPLKEVSMSTDQRIVLDKQSQAHYKFKWPDTMLVANPVMAKLKKMLEKK